MPIVRSVHFNGICLHSFCCVLTTESTSRLRHPLSFSFGPHHWQIESQVTSHFSLFTLDAFSTPVMLSPAHVVFQQNKNRNQWAMRLAVTGPAPNCYSVTRCLAGALNTAEYYAENRWEYTLFLCMLQSAYCRTEQKYTKI